MSGGESDAVKYIKVKEVEDRSSDPPPSIDLTNLGIRTFTTTGTNTNSFTTTTYPVYTGTSYPYWSYLYPTTIYKYQIKCPAKTCKTSNWLELDKITPCQKCGLKLKAVSEQADFEIPINV